jgi:hypothetical protein
MQLHERYKEQNLPQRERLGCLQEIHESLRVYTFHCTAEEKVDFQVQTDFALLF